MSHECDFYALLLILKLSSSHYMYLKCVSAQRVNLYEIYFATLILVLTRLGRN